MTVLARRQEGRWVLANALPYHTAAWRRETRGRITFRVAPSLTFNASRAERAAAFVDSLAMAFGVAPPLRLDYYVTESVDQALAILGARFPRTFGAAGGFAKPVNWQVFSGIPSLGEEYRHEIAHVVLLPIIRGSSTSLLASEGVPTWLGGTAGRDYPSAVRYLDSLLVAHPEVTLDRIVDDRIVDDQRVSSDIRNAAGAVLADMVHEAGGVAALRVYLRTPVGEMRSTLARLLATPWADVAGAWRARVAQMRDAHA
jgi:hypothetical protein